MCALPRVPLLASGAGGGGKDLAKVQRILEQQPELVNQKYVSKLTSDVNSCTTTPMHGWHIAGVATASAADGKHVGREGVAQSCTFTLICFRVLSTAVSFRLLCAVVSAGA